MTRDEKSPNPIAQPSKLSFRHARTRFCSYVSVSIVMTCC